MSDAATIIEELPFARQQRFRFVETLLLWKGSITRREVSEAFGVTPNHVTRDLDLYQQLHPDYIVFQPRKHAYVVGPKFVPVYASDDPAEHLGLLQTHAETGSAAVMPLLGGADVAVSTLPSPALGIERDVLGAVLQAIRLKRGLALIYHSLQVGQPEARVIWPHALLNTGVRWYARAYDGGNETFRDFVLSRMQTPRPHDEPPPRSADADMAWTTQVRAEVIPHPKLNAYQQRVVAREFAMKRERAGWVWSIRLRQAVIGYFARRYRLDAKPPVDPQSHWIVLRNRSALSAFFLSGAAD